jgi:hypothetical protein
MRRLLKAQVYPWRNRGFVYLAVPKAACSSVKWAICEARGVEIPGPHPEWHIHQAPWPEEMRFDRVRHNQVPAFAVVRHPVQRIVSCFVSKLHKDRIDDLRRDHPEIDLGMKFEDFVAFVCSRSDESLNEHLASQTHLLSDDCGLLPLTVLKMERIARDWAPIAKRHRLPALRKINANGEYKVKTKQSIVNKIRDRYKADFYNFGY